MDPRRPPSPSLNRAGEADAAAADPGAGTTPQIPREEEAILERVQRSLTITLRPGFLEDKGEALRALIGLYLQDGRAERAFESLERAKSQTLLGYLANREQLRWASDEPRSRALIAELDQLREEHQWFYRLAHEQPAEEAGRPGKSPHGRARQPSPGA